MPVTITPDASQRLRTSVMAGTVTDGELIAAYRALLESPDYDATLDDLVDAREIVRVEVTPDGVREVAGIVAAMDAKNPGTRVAIVAPGGAAYVMARLYGFYREAQNAPAEHRVFRDMTEAHTWLARRADG